MIISKKAYLFYATHFAITDQNDEIWKTDGWHAGTSLSYIRGVVPQMMRPATTCQMTQTDAATIAAVAACTASPYILGPSRPKLEMMTGQLSLLRLWYQLSF